jgi:hypothetical protein
MGWNLPTLAEMQARRRAAPKGIPAVIERDQKRKSKVKSEDVARAECWQRDRSICRATNVRLVRSGTTDPHKLGECDHTIMRSKDITRKYDVSNLVLISKYLNRLRKVRCANAGQFLRFDHEPVTPGDEDCGKARRFIWRDNDGTITKETISDKDGRIKTNPVGGEAR